MQQVWRERFLICKSNLCKLVGGSSRDARHRLKVIELDKFKASRSVGRTKTFFPNFLGEEGAGLTQAG